MIHSPSELLVVLEVFQTHLIDFQQFPELLIDAPPHFKVHIAAGTWATLCASSDGTDATAPYEHSEIVLTVEKQFSVLIGQITRSQVRLLPSGLLYAERCGRWYRQSAYLCEIIEAYLSHAFLPDCLEQVRIRLISHIVRFIDIKWAVLLSVALLCDIMPVAHSIVKWSLYLQVLFLGVGWVRTGLRIAKNGCPWHPIIDQRSVKVVKISSKVNNLQFNRTILFAIS